MFWNKKGQVFGNLAAMATGIAVLAITLVITFLIISQGRAQEVQLNNINTSNAATFTTGYNATQTLGEAVSTIPGWVPLIVIAVIGSVLLGLVALFRNRR
jgi:hypothetical protein